MLRSSAWRIAGCSRTVPGCARCRLCRCRWRGRCERGTWAALESELAHGRCRHPPHRSCLSRVGSQSVRGGEAPRRARLLKPGVAGHAACEHESLPACINNVFIGAPRSPGTHQATHSGGLTRRSCGRTGVVPVALTGTTRPAAAGFSRRAGKSCPARRPARRTPPRCCLQRRTAPAPALRWQLPRHSAGPD